MLFYMKVILFLYHLIKQKTSFNQTKKIMFNQKKKFNQCPFSLSSKIFEFNKNFEIQPKISDKKKNYLHSRAARY